MHTESNRSLLQRRPLEMGMSLLIGIISPFVVYFVVRPHVENDTMALAIAWVIPVVWTLISSVWHRRIDAISLLGVIAYGLALGTSVLLGGSSLPLKLHRAVLLGAIGIACLVSVALGRPLLLPALRFFARGDASRRGLFERASTSPVSLRRVTVITLVIGITCLADATIQTILAVVLPTSAFVAVTTLVRVIVLIGGAAVLAWYLFVAKHKTEKP